ncbi:MAG TPA: TadE/TadG family type IV pilus assembly protein [Acidimicrobiales bacterium]|jgi:hypothetical protein|nr:TadE/TadG family type IV pilus assembly protein [Acidimicrobiales bacterium]HVM03066.1 TadE/TadG family type IV pilus assembly protein [Acidimicrobiales bacterium]
MRRLRGAAPDERGVTLVMVAAFLVVMMVMAALVVDVGAMVHERRELQNGADAVALSVAHSCALGEPACSAAPSDSPLAALAGANAVDGATAIQSIAVDAAARTVTVRTRTLTSSGGGVLPFNFAPVFSSKAGETLHATAVAAWGPPTRGQVLPLGMSVCEWRAVQLDVQATTIFHTNVSSSCTGPAGQDVPGGFGWLDPVAGTCLLELASGEIASARTGAAKPATCDLGALVGKDLLVPIFDLIDRQGTIARYRIVGFGAFRLTGYRFPADNSNPAPCSAPQTCIAGVFARFVQNTGGPIGGGEFGVSIVKLVS